MSCEGHGDHGLVRIQGVYHSRGIEVSSSLYSHECMSRSTRVTTSTIFIVVLAVGDAAVVVTSAVAGGVSLNEN